MRRKSSAYGTYRGREGASGVLKGLALFLAILLVLAVAAFFYLQQYMVYDSDGTARLELPFFQRESPPPSITPPPVTVTQTPTPSPTPPPRLEQEKVRPVILGREALYDGTAADAIMEAGANAALFDMKWDTGELGWVTGQSLAITAKVSAGDPAINVATSASAEEDGVYRIARVSCFKDHLLSNADTSLAILTNSGYRWTDPDAVRWVSPTSQTVRDYLAALCAELAELGFDEILLEHAGYPTQGKLGYIKKGSAYDAREFEAVITAFYAQVAGALEGTDTRLSVVYDPESTPLSGQSLEAIRAAGALPVIRGTEGALLWPEAAGTQAPQPEETAPSP